MQKIAWSITYKWTFKTEKLLINNIINELELGTYNVYLYWETEIISSEEFVKSMKKRIKWKLLNFDISISSEDRLKIFEPKSKWKYLLKTTHGEEFETVIEAKKWPNIIAIREAETSPVIGGRVIKIDYII